MYSLQNKWVAFPLEEQTFVKKDSYFRYRHINKIDEDLQI